MGTELVNARGDSSALFNCAFLSTEGIDLMDDPSFPFTRLMDMSMLGCLAGDTWIMTATGPQQMKDLCQGPSWVLLNGDIYKATPAWSTGIKETFKLSTVEGYELTLTADHQILRDDGEWVEAKNLVEGDSITLNNNRNIPSWSGKGSWEEGYLCGLFRGDGNLERAKNSPWRSAVIRVFYKDTGYEGIMEEAEKASAIACHHRKGWMGWRKHMRHGICAEETMGIEVKMLARFGIYQDGKPLTTKIESTSMEFHRGFLRGFFDADGSVTVAVTDRYHGARITLKQSDYPALQVVQRMLLRLGIKSRINKAHGEEYQQFPDGRKHLVRAAWELIISSDNIQIFADHVGFSHHLKAQKLQNLLDEHDFYSKSFTTTVKSIQFAGEQEVFDISVNSVHAMDANGIVAHNCGVGFDTRGSGKITLHEPSGRFNHVVGDSREGWCESLGSLLRAFFVGSRMPVFDYSRVRPAGSPIKTFGGTASGPAPLQKLHDRVTQILSARAGQTLTSRDIVDIMNLAGKCVVSANVRRSAEIALGSADDEDFLDLKNWETNPERNGKDGWGHLSNNSVITYSGEDCRHLISRIRLNGEPGIFWQDIAQNYGRLVDPPDGRDHRVRGLNPCGEIPLEGNGELCCLVETFPANCGSMQDYIRTLKFAYLYAKTSNLLMTRWKETNEVMIRNRRIGTSMTGVTQFAETHGWPELRRWQDAGYQEIRRWDKIYSEWLGVRESIRVTTIKPSGTVSLLFGATPGCHFPKERGFYVRTVRETKDSPLAKAMEDAGYPIEPSYSDPDTTVVINFPVEAPDIRSESEVSIWEKISLAAFCQKYWSDNAVSCTISFREDEANEIPAVLRAFDGQVKSVSFLPIQDGLYRQAPYQKISREEWEAMRAKIKPIDWDRLYAAENLPEAAGEMFCSNDSCEIPQR